jgi:hypothetical protein
MYDLSQYKPTFPAGALVDTGQGPQQVPYASGTSNAAIDPNTGRIRGTTPTLVDRYLSSPDASLSPLDQARKELADQYKANSVTPDAQAIRDEVYKNSQMYIDAVNKRYDDLYGQERQAANVRNDQVRAFNISSGNVGGDFASANSAGQEKLNQKALDQINQQRQLELTGLFDKLDQRARDEYEAKKQEALGNAQKYVDYLQQNQDDTLGTITNIAKAGLSLAELKKQQTATGENVYDFIKRTTGKSDLELDALYQANLPASAQSVVHWEKVGNKILQFVTNPKTGETKKKEYDTDIADDEEFKEVDGVPYAVTKDANGKLVLRPLAGYTPNPKTQLELENKRLQNIKLRQDISQGGGGGGLSKKEELARINALRDDIRQDPDIKNFIDIRDGYERVQTGASMSNAQGDLSLLFGYMKLLDPTSVVRESEFANAEAAMGYAQKVLNIPNKLIKGNRLTKEAREQFSTAAKSLYGRKEQSYNRAKDFYSESARNAQLDPKQVIRDFGTTIQEKIRVKLQNGQTGTIDAADFDPKTMTKL